MADTKLSALSAVSVPDLADPLYGEQGGASGQYTITRVGGLLDPLFTTGRLTLVTGTAFTGTDQAAKGTLYFTSVGNDGTVTANHFQIVIFDGTRLRLYDSAEISLALLLTSGKNYDVFIYDNSGTLTLELSAAWTNNSTRADALAAQSGQVVKSGATTRRWIGTIRASATDKTDDSHTKRLVWNAYNQRLAGLGVLDTAHGAGYTTASYREWNNGTSITRLQFVMGAVGLVTAIGGVEIYANTGVQVEADVALDWDTRAATGFGNTMDGMAVTNANFPFMRNSYGLQGYPAAGFHDLTMVQYGGAGGTFNYYAITASLWM